jgi:UDP-N-acetylmuramoyl-tripeptide--D-alanyl-D-alanine ligase
MQAWPTTVNEAPHERRAGAPSLDAAELARVTRGALLVDGRLPIRGAAVDSRRVTAGACFFALAGERTDGHRFLGDAVARGAAALVVRQALTESDRAALTTDAPITIIQVGDPLAALHAVAAAWRSRFDPLVVGVTGSVGKTSTKEQIAEVLAERSVVLRNEGNENNEIGLPLTLLRLLPEHECAVLEMGMYVAGDIALLARLARPRIGVVTAVRGTHLSRAGSIEAIEQGKAELVEALPRDGFAVLNADDERVARMRERTRARVVTYGFDGRADVRAESLESLGEAGMRFMLTTPQGRVPIESPALGRHSAHNALAAAAVGIAAGLDLATVARALGRGFRVPHRTALVRAGGWRILDDSYNAAPDSMSAALDVLGGLGGRRIAVLGEMLELGPVTRDAHLAVGRHAARTADRLVVVGEGASPIGEGAREAGMSPSAVARVLDRDAALEHLLRTLRPGDAVLVKASRGIELDRLVADLVDAAGRDPVRA